MTIHVSANTGCNLGCEYCYENPDRDVTEQEINSEYDIDLIMDQLEEWKDKYQEAPGLHGGEPLLLDDDDLERIFSWVHEHYNEGGHIQTNGTLISDRHIEMFQEYDVSVGVSMDGAEELNRARLATTGDEDVTDKMTNRTQENVVRLVKNNINVGIIIVLSEVNAGTDDKLDKLLEWMDWLNQNGISGHFNPAIPYEDQNDIALSPERLKKVYLRTWEWVKEEPYRTWETVQSAQNKLLGFSLGNCIHGKCDVYDTKAAKIIRGDGSTTGCGKTWPAVGDGPAFLQGDSVGNEYGESDARYKILKNTPGPYSDEVQNGDVEDQGGCKGCRFWNICHGGCPSAGLDYDYRNRTRWCEAQHALYERVEEDMKSLFPHIRLLSDGEWDQDPSGLINSGLVDIKPFAAMRDDLSNGGRDIRRGGTVPHVGTVTEEINTSIEENEEKLPFDRRVQRYKERYDTDILSIDSENNRIHADTGQRDGNDDHIDTDTHDRSGSTDPEHTDRKRHRDEQRGQHTDEEKSKHKDRLKRDPDEIDESEQLSDEEFEAKIQRYKEEFDEDILKINWRTKSIHADSSRKDEPSGGDKRDHTDERKKTHTDRLKRDSDEIEDLDDLSDEEFDKKVKKLKEEYDEEIVKVNRETKSIHVDSASRDEITEWDGFSDND